MARPLRIEFPGAVYHITSRGNRRMPIYQDDGDKALFLEVLGQVHQRFGWDCYAYCLMDNHYHLVVETPKANLSRGMRQLNGIYTQQTNLRHRMVGHLFQGRFKAILVEADSYLLEVCRYVVLNPVRARVVQRAQHWRWSSYRATAGLTKAQDWLCVDGVLAMFGQERSQAQRRYQEFVREGIGGESPWAALQGQIVLGSEAFVAQCRALIEGKQAEEVPRMQRHVGRPTLQRLFGGVAVRDQKNRRKRACQAHVVHGYPLKEIGDFLGVHYSTVSKWVNKKTSMQRWGKQ